MPTPHILRMYILFCTRLTKKDYYCSFFNKHSRIILKGALMNKYLVILSLAITTGCKSASSMYVGQVQKASNKRDLSHSNIYIQKITNASKHSAFVAVERNYVLPYNDRMDLSGHIMPGKDFELKDFEGTPYLFAVPLWKNSFRGSTLNVITLSGNPGRIYFLYVINGHLWAVKAPSKEGEMRGIHLLDPAQHDRTFDLKILDDNVLSLIPVAGNKKGSIQQPARATTTQNKPIQKKVAPQASALQQRPTAPK